MTESQRPDSNLLDDPLARRARALLDESAAGLDAATLTRLHQARNRAVAGAGRPAAWFRLGLPAATLAATATLVALLTLPLERPTPAEQTPLVMEDLDLLVELEELELIEEMEFYGWLAAQPDAT